MKEDEAENLTVWLQQTNTDVGFSGLSGVLRRQGSTEIARSFGREPFHICVFFFLSPPPFPSLPGCNSQNGCGLRRVTGTPRDCTASWRGRFRGGGSSRTPQAKRRQLCRIAHVICSIAIFEQPLQSRSHTRGAFAEGQGEERTGGCAAVSKRSRRPDLVLGPWLVSLADAGRFQYSTASIQQDDQLHHHHHHEPTWRGGRAERHS